MSLRDFKKSNVQNEHICNKDIGHIVLLTLVKESMSIDIKGCRAARKGITLK